MKAARAKAQGCLPTSVLETVPLTVQRRLDAVNRVVLLCGEIGGDAGEGRQAHSSSHHSISGRDVQAIFFRRRHHPRSPPPAKIRPGSPAPTMGPGTATPVSEKLALNGPWWVTSVPIRSQSGFKSSYRIQLSRSPGKSGGPAAHSHKKFPDDNAASGRKK